jgi:uncharacterized protein YacL (UPF0231 family)
VIKLTVGPGSCGENEISFPLGKPLAHVTLAHEIAHHKLRHCQIAQEIISLTGSHNEWLRLEHEIQAWLLAKEWLQSANQWTPQVTKWVIQILEQNALSFYNWLPKEERNNPATLSQWRKKVKEATALLKSSKNLKNQPAREYSHRHSG